MGRDLKDFLEEEEKPRDEQNEFFFVDSASAEGQGRTGGPGPVGAASQAMIKGGQAPAGWWSKMDAGGMNTTQVGLRGGGPALLRT